MKRRISKAPLALLLFALGCGGSSEQESPASAAGATPSAATSSPAADPEPSPTAPSAEERPAEARARLEKLRESLDEAVSGAFTKMIAAVQSGIEVERGDTPCERAFTGWSGMIAHLMAAMPESETPLSLPDRAEFAAVCGALGPEMQRCLQLGYSMQNQEECQRVHAALSAADVERLESVTMRQTP